MGYSDAGMAKGEVKPLIGLTLDGLRRVAEVCGMPRFAAGQMARWLYEKRVGGIDDMTDLSKEARRRLRAIVWVGSFRCRKSVAPMVRPSICFAGLGDGMSKVCLSPTMTGLRFVFRRRRDAR